MKLPLRVFIGWDARELRAWNVAQSSMRLHTRTPTDVQRIGFVTLQIGGRYTRPTEEDGSGGLFDVISQAPMSTGHAIARFFVPLLCGYDGWALFTDGDVLFRSDVADLFLLADPQYAVQVVQQVQPVAEDVKKNGMPQLVYPRKNWSSVMLFNCGHPANRALTLDVLNTWPGRDLHAFAWLSDEQIGALPAGWNYLVNVTEPRPDPVHLAHYTLGAPDLQGHARDPFSAEWFSQARACGYHLEAAVFA